MQGKIFFLFEYPKNLKMIFKCIHTVYDNTVLDTVYSAQYIHTGLCFMTTGDGC